MHHYLKNQERALNLSILISSGPGEFPRCPSVNFFKFQPCDYTPPRTQKL
ncbi:hypothetical protein K504DRAFT_445297 [Pleomassaria siparia CBS 279.74]|uniref:Uncharacterized protein n=1 Tax=Pleomassaria siparia CBS 279.74 TaxID=1314801 RepID=A0A6G1JQ44_9PLEO|nr:hypothetical protein K504DRAFT_445297 [Pleomassaria siparia CBS 279.74]